jgi:hypothetical protein
MVYPEVVVVSAKRVPVGGSFRVRAGPSSSAGLAGRVTAEFFQSEMERYLIPPSVFWFFGSADPFLSRGGTGQQGESIPRLWCVTDALAVAGLWAFPLLAVFDNPCPLVARAWTVLVSERYFPTTRCSWPFPARASPLLFHLVRFPLSLWHRWPALRYLSLCSPCWRGSPTEGRFGSRGWRRTSPCAPNAKNASTLFATRHGPRPRRSFAGRGAKP